MKYSTRNPMAMTEPTVKTRRRAVKAGPRNLISNNIVYCYSSRKELLST
jgi:hypothetical protein